MRDGLLVMVGGPPLTVEDVNELIRQGYEERHKRIMEGTEPRVSRPAVLSRRRALKLLMKPYARGGGARCAPS